VGRWSFKTPSPPPLGFPRATATPAAHISSRSLTLTGTSAKKSGYVFLIRSSLRPLQPQSHRMAQKPIQIDRDKLRAEVRKLGDEYVFSMLDDAIELLPRAKLHKIAKKYLDVKRLRPDAQTATKPDLLADVKRFEKASLA